MEKEVVVLVHGIRDFAYWQSEIRRPLEEAGFVVEPTNYGRFDLLRFLAPVPFFRNSVIERVWHQLEQVYQSYPNAQISIIAHSFGTYVVSRLMQRKFNFRAHRIVFCGSVVPYDAPLEQVKTRFDAPLLNEVGTRDIWPAVAESVTFGYGSAGSYGFKRPFARDRWHRGAGHSFFLSKSFCEKFWVPFLKSGKIVDAEVAPELPVFWVRLLYVIPVKYVVAIALALSIYSLPRQVVDAAPTTAWVSAAEVARNAKTIHESAPIPSELSQARTTFEEWWRNAGLRNQRKLDPELVFKALAYNTRLYRMFEKRDELKPNSKYWADQCVRYFAEVQLGSYLTECLIDQAAIYLDLSQIEHTNAERFREIAREGDAAMTRAASVAQGNQKADVLRISSRFYYNLARPRDGMLSSEWSNDYLALALNRAEAAYNSQPENLLNLTQFSRALQRFAANPPQLDDALWTEKLRSVQAIMAQAYKSKVETLQTPTARIPPANILAVITMDLARREWQASSRSSADAQYALRLLTEESLQPQRDAWAMVDKTEWAKDYSFDLNYDLARIKSVITQILDAVGDVRADDMFRQALQSMSAAVGAASAIQLKATAASIRGEPSLAGLRDDRRRQLISAIEVR